MSEIRCSVLFSEHISRQLCINTEVNWLHKKIMTWRFVDSRFEVKKIMGTLYERRVGIEFCR